VLILADEPTGNLDTETTELVMDLFHHYNEKGTTLLIATHDHSIYNYPGSKVVTIEQGRMLVAGDSNDSGEPSRSIETTGMADATSLKVAGSGHQEGKLDQQIVIKRDLGDYGNVRRKGAEV
jgi:energy-coupling factor transporter ATP-binding protein EcfA2